MSLIPKLTAEQKLLNEALGVLKHAHIDLKELSLPANDCLWLAFTQPPHNLEHSSCLFAAKKLFTGRIGSFRGCCCDSFSQKY